MSSTVSCTRRPTLPTPPPCCAPPSPFPTPWADLPVRCFCPHTLKEQWSHPVRTQIHSRHHSAQNPTIAVFFPQSGSQVLPLASKAHQDLLTSLPPLPSAPSHHLPTLLSAPPPMLSCRPWHLQLPSCLLGILPQIPTPLTPLPAPSLSSDVPSSRRAAWPSQIQLSRSPLSCPVLCHSTLLYYTAPVHVSPTGR